MYGKRKAFGELFRRPRDNDTPSSSTSGWAVATSSTPTARAGTHAIPEEGSPPPPPTSPPPSSNDLAQHPTGSHKLHISVSSTKATTGIHMSPIGCPPPDVRKRIYHFTLKLPKPIIITSKGKRHVARHHGSEVLTLLLTCRAVKHECHNIFYTTNTFVLRHSTDKLHAIATFCRFRDALGKTKKKVLRNIIFDAGEFYVEGWNQDRCDALRTQLQLYLGEAMSQRERRVSASVTFHSAEAAVYGTTVVELAIDVRGIMSDAAFGELEQIIMFAAFDEEKLRLRLVLDRLSDRRTQMSNAKGQK